MMTDIINENLNLKWGPLYLIHFSAHCFFLLMTTCFLVVISVPNGYAAKSYGGSYYTGPEDHEIARLPEYLRVKVLSFLGVKNKDINDKKQKYFKLLGPGYQPTHHYGVGLICLDRVKLSSRNMKPQMRRFNLESAVVEFDFVIRHAEGTNLKILYEVWFRKGEALMLLNKYDEAIKSFYASIKLNPDFSGSYIKLSECFLILGDKKSSDKMLELGRQKSKKQ